MAVEAWIFNTRMREARSAAGNVTAHSQAARHRSPRGGRSWPRPQTSPRSAAAGVGCVSAMRCGRPAARRSARLRQRRVAKRNAEEQPLLFLAKRGRPRRGGCAGGIVAAAALGSGGGGSGRHRKVRRRNRRRQPLRRRRLRRAGGSGRCNDSENACLGLAYRISFEQRVQHAAQRGRNTELRCGGTGIKQRSHQRSPAACHHRIHSRARRAPGIAPQHHLPPRRQQRNEQLHRRAARLPLAQPVARAA